MLQSSDVGINNPSARGNRRSVPTGTGLLFLCPKRTKPTISALPETNQIKPSRRVVSSTHTHGYFCFSAVIKKYQSRYRYASVSLIGGSWHTGSAGWMGHCSNDPRLCGLRRAGCCAQAQSRSADRHSSYGLYTGIGY